MARRPAFYRKGFAYIGVYCIYNERFYIGCTSDFVMRFRTHISDLKCGRHPNKNLQEDFNNHGVQCFLFKPILSTDKRNMRSAERSVMTNCDINLLYNSVLACNKHLFTKSLGFIELIKWIELQTKYNSVIFEVKQEEVTPYSIAVNIINSNTNKEDKIRMIENEIIKANKFLQ